jgi:hypothetical protein
MISHQHPGVNSPPSAFADLAQSSQKDFPVAFIAENRFAAVAAIEEMIRGAGNFYASFPGHKPGDPIAPANASSSQNCRDSSTDPFPFFSLTLPLAPPFIYRWASRVPSPEPAIARFRVCRG